MLTSKESLDPLLALKVQLASVRAVDALWQSHLFSTSGSAEGSWLASAHAEIVSHNCTGDVA
jgi:hypothetical protein